MAFFVAIVTSLGGGAVAVLTNWWGGIITQSKLDAAMEQKANVSQIIDLEVKIRDVHDSKLMTEIRMGVEVKERASLQVGLYQAMRLAHFTEEQRNAVERFMVNARSRHDFLIMQLKMTPVDAAKQVVDEYKIQR